MVVYIHQQTFMSLEGFAHLYKQIRAQRDMSCYILKEPMYQVLASLVLLLNFRSEGPSRALTHERRLRWSLNFTACDAGPTTTKQNIILGRLKILYDGYLQNGSVTPARYRLPPTALSAAVRDCINPREPAWAQKQESDGKNRLL